MPFALFRSGTTAVLSAALAVGQAPATPKRPVTDTYHGVKVTDNYRWLEKDADPEVKAWSAAQNRYARAFLDPSPRGPRSRTSSRSCMAVHPPHIRLCAIGAASSLP